MKKTDLDASASPRLQMSLPVTLRVGADDEATRTAEVALGGVFVAADRPIALRQLVQLEIELPGGVKLEVDGMVVMVVSVDDAHRLGTVPGVGVQFYSVGEIDEDRWRQFIESALRDSCESFLDQPDDPWAEEEDTCRSTLVGLGEPGGRDDLGWTSEEHMTTLIDEPDSVERIARAAGLDPRIVAAALANDEDSAFIDDGPSPLDTLPELGPPNPATATAPPLEIAVSEDDPVVLIEARKKPSLPPPRAPDRAPIQIIGPEPGEASPSSPPTSRSARSKTSNPPPVAPIQIIGSSERPRSGRPSGEGPKEASGDDRAAPSTRASTQAESALPRGIKVDDERPTLQMTPVKAGKAEVAAPAPSTNLPEDLATSRLSGHETAELERGRGDRSAAVPFPGGSSSPQGSPASREALARAESALAPVPTGPSQAIIALGPRGPAPLAPTGLLRQAVYRIELPSVQALEGFSLTALGSGGVFIKTSALSPAGSPAVICLVHPLTGDEFHIPGVVATVRKDRPGVGVRFAGDRGMVVREFRRFIAVGSAARAAGGGARQGLSRVHEPKRPLAKAGAGPRDTQSVRLQEVEPFRRR